MMRRAPSSTRTATHLPYTTHFRTHAAALVGVGVAATGLEIGEVLLAAVGYDRRIGEVVGAEVVGQVQLRRGAGRDADGGAVEFRKLAHAEEIGRASCRERVCQYV